MLCGDVTDFQVRRTGQENTRHSHLIVASASHLNNYLVKVKEPGV
jgi:hypothetical protein